jgi:hypothetical protein
MPLVDMTIPIDQPVVIDALPNRYFARCAACARDVEARLLVSLKAPTECVLCGECLLEVLQECSLRPPADAVREVLKRAAGEER